MWRVWQEALYHRATCPVNPLPHFQFDPAQLAVHMPEKRVDSDNRRGGMQDTVTHMAPIASPQLQPALLTTRNSPRLARIQDSCGTICEIRLVLSHTYAASSQGAQAMMVCAIQ